MKGSFISIKYTESFFSRKTGRKSRAWYRWKDSKSLAKWSSKRSKWNL